MSLEQITAAKKEAQHELEAARNNPKATTSDVARLKSAVKSLQRAEAAKRSDPAGAGRSAHLLYGTARHKTQQYQDTTWAQSMGADSEAEFPIVKPDGSKGRVDHIIYLDGSRQNVLITEYKTDRFDLRTEKGLADRMDEIFDQINGYRFSKQLEDIESSQTLLHIDHRPTTTGYAEYVEERCAEKGVSVIFLDD
jgi:hypothetical protein